MKVLIKRSDGYHRGTIERRQQYPGDHRKYMYRVRVYYNMTQIMRYGGHMKEDLFPYSELEAMLNGAQGIFDK